MPDLIKLNLGCGSRKLESFVNVDKYGEPDIEHDLEVRPWPWEDDCAEEFVFNHALEHMGQSSDDFIGILKEVWRIGVHGARLRVHVPHPRHDDFLGDPTHVRVILPVTLSLFSKRLNRQWKEAGAANTTLGLYHDIDLEFTDIKYILDPRWEQKMVKENLDEQAIRTAMSELNNVCKEIQMTLSVIKEA